MTNAPSESTQSAAPGTRVRFGGFVLDTVAWSLVDERGERPRTVRLDQRAMQVLAYLIAQRPRVISKDELFEQVWANQVVSDNALTQAVTRARRALGENSRETHWIQTLRNRGYRFIGELDPAVTSQIPRVSASTRRSWPVIGIGLAAALVLAALGTWLGRPVSLEPASANVSQRQSPLVERLQNVALDIQGLADDPQAQVFAQSMNNALRTALPDLFGASTTGPGDPAPARLTGTILTRGNESVINLELLHHAADEPLWHIQDHRIPSTYSLHYRERLVDTLAALTRRPVHPDNRLQLRRAVHQPQTPFELLVKGRQLYLEFNQSANEQAIAHFEQALAQQPDWFPAQSSLALSVVARRHRYQQEAHWLDEGAAIARKAINQSQNAYDAWRALGMVALERGQPETALEYFQTALVLAPEHYPTVYTVGLTLYNMGRLDEAIAVYTRIQRHPIGRALLVNYLVELGLGEEAERLSKKPFSNAREFALANYALLYRAALEGDFEQARELGDDLQRRYPSMKPTLLRLCAEIEQRAGNLDLASNMYREAFALDPNNSDLRIRMAEVWLSEGEGNRAADMLERVVTELTASIAAGTSNWTDMRTLATAEALRGNAQQALHWRARSIAAGAYTNAWDESDSRFQSLADHPEFVQQTLTMQAKVTQMRSRALDHLLAGSPKADDESSEPEAP